MTTNTPYNPNTANPLTLAWENYKKSWVHWGTRATRREYWWSWFIGVSCCNLFWISSMAVCMLFEPAFTNRNESLILSILFCIPIVLLGIPSLGLVVRRCHDAGFPTMGVISLTILLLIPYLGALFAVLLFFALIQDSDKAENPWGISTKYQLPQKHSPEVATNTTAVYRAKDILNCRGYYSGKAFAWHVGIAAVLSFIITLWSFGPAALFAPLLQRFEILQSIWLKQNIEYILLMFASVTWITIELMAIIAKCFIPFILLAFPAFIKRFRYMGKFPTTFYVWVLWGLLWSFVLQFLENIIDFTSFVVVLECLESLLFDNRDISFDLIYFAQIIFLLLFCILGLFCCLYCFGPENQVPQTTIGNKKTRFSLNCKYIAFTILTLLYYFNVLPIHQWCDSFFRPAAANLPRAVELGDAAKLQNLLADCTPNQLNESITMSPEHELITVTFYFPQRKPETSKYTKGSTSDLELIRMIIQAGGNPHRIVGNQLIHIGPNPDTLYWHALKSKNKELLRVLNEYKGPIDNRTINDVRNTLLHVVAAAGDAEYLKVLLSLTDVNVNAKNAKGQTPLDLATEKGHTDIANLLKAAGAN